MSDYRVIITSNMEGIQNLSVGALEAFLPVYAVTVAGLSAFQAGMLWGHRLLPPFWQNQSWEKSLTDMAENRLSFSGMWICAIPFACIPLTRDFYLLLSLAAVFGVGEAFVTSSSAAMVAEFARNSITVPQWGYLAVSSILVMHPGPILAGFLLCTSQLSILFSHYFDTINIGLVCFRSNGIREKKNYF